MRKDITIEKMKLGGEKENKSKLPRRYGLLLGNNRLKI